MHSLLNLAAQHRNEIILAAAAVTTVIAARVVMGLLFKQGGGGAGGFEGFTDTSPESESSSSSESVFDAVDSFSAENEVQKEQREKQLAGKKPFFLRFGLPFFADTDFLVIFFDFKKSRNRRFYESDAQTLFNLPPSRVNIGALRRR